MLATSAALDIALTLACEDGIRCPVTIMATMRNMGVTLDDAMYATAQVVKADVL